MKKIMITGLCLVFFTLKANAAFFLHNDYSYLQEITFELYTDEVPAYKVPEQLKSIEETLMFEVLHATWKDKHWVAYTLNKNLLGTFKVGQPALLDNDASKKIFFVAAFPGSLGGLDLYSSEYNNGSWSKPKNLGKTINTAGNESNPGLLNENTLTYSSGGIIKKLNLKTLKVVDLEEASSDDLKSTDVVSNTVKQNNEIKNEKKDIVAAIGDNSTAAPSGSGTPVSNDYGAIGDNSTAVPLNSGEGKGMMQNQTRVANETIVVQEKSNNQIQPAPKMQQINAPASKTIPATATQNTSVQSLGTQSRDAMLAKYKTAIQLGAFSAPKWELIEPLSKYGKIITYKNDNGSNVVWIVGFSNKSAAEAVLPQVKATPGFENAYVTGK